MGIEKIQNRYRFKLFLVEHLVEPFSGQEERDGGYALTEWYLPNSRTSSKVCLFAHFDPDGHIHEYVLDCLRQIREKGEFDIVFCSTSEKLKPEDVEKVKELCFLGIQRSNEGIDFGSWNIALRELEKNKEEYSSILLVNDSVYGPLFDLEPIFEKMESSSADFIGLSESREHCYHLQSYFLLLKKQALKSSFFRQFKNSFDFSLSKRMIIWKYEIGLTQKLLSEGLLGESIYETGCHGGHGRTNPTIDHGLELIEGKKFPFLKRKLVADKCDEGRSDWENVLGRVNEKVRSQVVDHIRRFLGRKP